MPAVAAETAFRLVRPETGAVLRECRSLREAIERRAVHLALAGLPGPLEVHGLDPHGQWVKLAYAALPEGPRK